MARFTEEEERFVAETITRLLIVEKNVIYELTKIRNRLEEIDEEYGSASDDGQFYLDEELAVLWGKEKLLEGILNHGRNEEATDVQGV